MDLFIFWVKINKEEKTKGGDRLNIGIILAAGEGKRMKSRHAKVLHKICGKPMISYVIEAADNSRMDKIIVVVGHKKEELVEYLKDFDVIIKEQPVDEKSPYGTAFAVSRAIDEVEDNDNVIVLCADTPLVTSDSISSLIEYHVNTKSYATVLTTELEDPTGYGRIISKGNGDLLKIVEDKDATFDEKKIKEINSGIYCFNGRALKESMGKIDNKNKQNEYYLTDAIEILNSEGLKVSAFKINNSEEILGVNSREQLATAAKIMQKRINKFHLDNGVTIVDPDNTYIEPNVIIGYDTVIYPGAIIETNSIIGQDCKIVGNTRIVNSVIGNGCEIDSTLIESSTIGSDCHIGPYAHLRPNCKIGNNVKIGNFVEIKNSNIGDNSKAAHLSYVGDADVGKNVNIGCGVVFVNYDGKNKFRSTVEDNAFIGSNSNLIAPVVIEKNGYVAAGSTITDDVNEGDLSIARARQVNIPGWVEKKGLKNHK